MAALHNSIHYLLLVVAMVTVTSGTYLKGVGSFGMPFSPFTNYGFRFGGVGLGHPGFALPVMPISFGYSYPVTHGLGQRYGYGRYGYGYGRYGYGGMGGFGFNRGWDDWDDDDDNWDRFDDFNAFDGIDNFGW